MTSETKIHGRVYRLKIYYSGFLNPQYGGIFEERSILACLLAFSPLFRIDFFLLI